MSRMAKSLFVFLLVLICSYGIVNDFGRDQNGDGVSYPRHVFWPGIESPLELCGMLVYQQIPLGKSPLSDSRQSYEWRLAAIQALSLGEQYREAHVPSTLSFIAKTGVVSIVAVLVLLQIQPRRDPVVSAWISHVGLRGAIGATWISSFGAATVSILIMNLFWMLWMKIHWIYRAETDYYELFDVQGAVQSQKHMIEEYPIAVGPVGPINVLLGGVVFYLAMLAMLIRRRSFVGAQKYEYCLQCGYPRAGDKSIICPECSLPNDQNQRQLGMLSRLKIKGLAVFIASFAMFSAPLWLGWFAPYIPEELLRFLPF